MIANDILVIADKPRIQRLLETIDPGWGGSVTIVSSLPEAEEHLAEGGAFGLVVIQDRLSGLSHELLLRHLRSLVTDGETMIACATDDQDIHDPSIHILDLSLPDRDLVRQMERLIARLPRADLSPFRETAPVTDEPTGHPPSAGEPPPPPPPEREPVATRFEEEFLTELARREEPLSPPVDEPLPSVDDLLAPTPERTGAPLGVFAGVVAVIMVIAAAVWFGATRPTPSGTTAKPAATPPPAPLQRRFSAADPLPADPLPPFISRENPRPDPLYGRGKPGWERYQSTRADFRVYRERGKIVALQVIARTPDGLPPRLFAAAIRETTGKTDYRTTSRQVEGEYLVKRGTLGDRGGVTIYKDRHDRLLHAFVITLTRGE